MDGDIHDLQQAEVTRRGKVLSEMRLRIAVLVLAERKGFEELAHCFRENQWACCVMGLASIHSRIGKRL
jgi:hypothetical protein